MAIVVGEDRLLAAPTVQSAFRDHARITFGGTTSEAEARELAAAIGASGIERIVFPKAVVLSAAEGARQLVGEAPAVPSPIPLTPGEERWAQVTVCVDEQGVVKDVKVLEGTAPEAAQQIAGPIRSWRYRPYLKGGKAVPFCYAMRLQGEQAR
jgi:hypothetical protein